MNTTSRIKQFLESGRPATVEKISKSLDLTKADIHYHVRQLLANNEISLCPQRFQSGPGRPARQYQLVRPIPLGLNKLIISILLEDRLDKDPEEREQNIFCQNLARRILSACPSTHEKSQSPAVRLNHCMNELALFGFILRWQAGKSGPLIMIDQEPLSSLLEEPKLVSKILQSIIHQIKQMIA